MTQNLHNLLKFRLIDFLNSMNDPRKNRLIQIYNNYKELFHFAAGSSHNHQAWKGGYADHIAEILRVNKATYTALEQGLRPLPFTEDSALIVLFFHDIEKLFSYGPAQNADCKKWLAFKSQQNLSWESTKKFIIEDLIDKPLEQFFTSDELNALKYTHGEGDDYKKDKRVACELAAHVHHCDNTSARIFHNDGQGLS